MATKAAELDINDKWTIRELLQFVEADRPLYYHFYSNWYNTYAKRKARTSWDKEKAISGLAGTFCTQVMRYYKQRYGAVTLSKAGKHEFGKQALAKLYEHGLKNVRVGSKPKLRDNPTIGTRDNFWANFRG